MDARPFRAFKSARAGFDVANVATRESGECHAAHVARDRGAGGKLALGTGRKPGFDDVDAKLSQCVREAQLLIRGHAAAGRLLAVAQGGVENRDARGRFAADVGIHQSVSIRRKPPERKRAGCWAR